MSTTQPLEPGQEPQAPVLTSGPAYEIPERFQPPKSALWIDRFMNHFIKVGGLSIITAVFGIFVFILVQILPLFQGAKVKELQTVQLPEGDYRMIGVDEWGMMPVVVTADGAIHSVDLAAGGKMQPLDPGYGEPKSITAFQYDPASQEIAVGTSDGQVGVLKIDYSSSVEQEERTVTVGLQAGPFYSIGNEGARILQVDYADAGQNKMVAVIQEQAGKKEVFVETLIQSQSLLGPGEIMPGSSFRPTPEIHGEPVKVAVNMGASDLVVSTRDGDIEYFALSGEELRHVQTFRPFGDLKDPAIHSMNYLFGGQSLVLTHASGAFRVFSVFTQAGAEKREFAHTKTFEPLPGGSAFFYHSIRNKAFLVGQGHVVSLRFSTTEDVRWEENLPFDVRLGAIGGKYDRLFLLDAANRLHTYTLSDPHPETSWKALFGKIWYEGAAEPSYSWQSTGATDDFEPKLSMVPLIVGTLKGTWYAMLFALPIALLAAIYTSQFLHPSFRVIVKPTMEIMASLPSVVLGFLAALWLAPALETRVPSILVMLVLVPGCALFFGWVWNQLPIRYRVWIKPGYEWLVFLPLLIVTSLFSWSMGPVLERIFFVTQDPETGRRVADFRLWWPQAMGLPYEQRNSLVVGFMMGFAVIPIIFTIAEDAMSNVPPALRSGSLALGASRWQTAVRIVIPTASAGIFSAIMIGLGRAVGETMIVVMATGNTPIMNFNIFSGMRTLSANIAVELPEAPVHGTLYRALFLGALALFLMTFAVNTFAEILRQRLREKYKTV